MRKMGDARKQVHSFAYTAAWSKTSTLVHVNVYKQLGESLRNYIRDTILYGTNVDPQAPLVRRLTELPKIQVEQQVRNAIARSFRDA